MKNWTFGIEATWAPATMAPAEIGARCVQMLRDLSLVSPTMSDWVVGDRPSLTDVPLDQFASNPAALVERDVRTDEADRPAPEDGYLLLPDTVVGGQTQGPRSAHVWVHAGSTWREDEIRFEIGETFRYPNDFDLITYPVFRGALQAIVSAWPCPWALAYTYSSDEPPVDLALDEEEPRAAFEIAWIAYLSAPLALGLRPPADFGAERTPGGGLIMSAVQGMFDAQDPVHMRCSRMLEAIMIERVGLTGPPLDWPAKHAARLGPF